MSTSRPDNPLAAEHFHAVDADTCQQTISESQIDYSIDMGGDLTIHHGFRYGTPIIIAERHKQKSDELAGVWYDDSTH